MSGVSADYGSSVATGITGTALATAGTINSINDTKWPTDPEVVAKQDASKRQIGAGVTTVGSTMATVGLTFPPYGLILSGAGAIVMGIGSGLVAGYSRDPVKTSIRNGFLKAGKSKAYSKEMSELIGLGPLELQAELAHSGDKTGLRNRDREQAARDLLDQTAVEQSARTANYILAQNQSTSARAVVESDKRRQILILAGTVVVVIIVLGVLSWRRK